MKSIFEQSGGTYTKVEDYYIPNITVPDTKKYNIGKYGNLRKIFLKEHHKSYYTALFMEGKLFEHPAEIDETCHKCLKDMVTKMAEQEGVTEQLKATDQMLWVRKMNSIHNRAEALYCKGWYSYHT
ncbi:TnpV protein [Qingrenia yutianensis]|uniref:TnpV protein n=1 Tax=Qingrenia yutianensis TaxID=2763676 RepID=A0A926F9U8_9FIRM|nr:TnpV protein [Qingrenia yutianensis]MBC8597371.1 TnpV protein [Qingrenia yutianensis]